MLFRFFLKRAKKSLAQLKLWSRHELRDRNKQANRLMEELRNIKQCHLHYVDGDRIKKIEKRLDAILIGEEIYWKQRSRADWLKEEDQNTKNFHAKASSRKKKNQIWGILYEDEKWTEEAEDIERVFCEYFVTLFSSTKSSQAQMEAALQEMPVKVTKEMNEMLDQPFSENEIAAALAQMCPTKASDPDGFPTTFF